MCFSNNFSVLYYLFHEPEHHQRWIIPYHTFIQHMEYKNSYSYRWTEVDNAYQYHQYLSISYISHQGLKYGSSSSLSSSSSAGLTTMFNTFQRLIMLKYLLFFKTVRQTFVQVDHLIERLPFTRYLTLCIDCRSSEARDC